MSSIWLVADAEASVSGAVVAALGDLTRAVDVLQQHSLDCLRDGDLLGVFQQVETQRRRLPAVSRTALASGDLPSNRGVSATVVLTMSVSDLQDAAAGVASTATGGVVPIRDALAMATDAHPVLCLFDTDGQPLHLGRGARLATSAQRLALYARDKGCTRPGCDIPPQWCEVHHLDDYQYGGHTDVDKMCLVCTFDHHLITHDGFTVRMGPAGRVEWTAPKHLDPDQTLRTNTIHHPPDLSDPDPP